MYVYIYIYIYIYIYYTLAALGAIGSLGVVFFLVAWAAISVSQF